MRDGSERPRRRQPRDPTRPPSRSQSRPQRASRLLVGHAETFLVLGKGPQRQGCKMVAVRVAESERSTQTSTYQGPGTCVLAGGRDADLAADVLGGLSRLHAKAAGLPVIRTRMTFATRTRRSTLAAGIDPKVVPGEARSRERGDHPGHLLARRPGDAGGRGGAGCSADRVKHGCNRVAVGRPAALPEPRNPYDLQNRTRTQARTWRPRSSSPGTRAGRRPSSGRPR